MTPFQLIFTGIAWLFLLYLLDHLMVSPTPPSDLIEWYRYLQPLGKAEIWLSIGLIALSLVLQLLDLRERSGVNRDMNSLEHYKSNEGTVRGHDQAVVSGDATPVQHELRRELYRKLSTPFRSRWGVWVWIAIAILVLAVAVAFLIGLGNKEHPIDTVDKIWELWSDFLTHEKLGLRTLTVRLAISLTLMSAFGMLMMQTRNEVEELTLLMQAGAFVIGGLVFFLVPVTWLYGLSEQEQAILFTLSLIATFSLPSLVPRLTLRTFGHQLVLKRVLYGAVGAAYLIQFSLGSGG